MANPEDQQAYENYIEDPEDPWSYNQRTLPENVPLRLLPAFAAMVHSDDPATAFHGVLMIRKILSVQEDPPIQPVVDAGVVPLLVQYLARDDWPEMQFEAAWAVSNIASGTQEHTFLIIRLNAVPHFVRLLESENEEVREQATWAVGNIAGDSADCRNYILGLGSMNRLINAIQMPYSKISVLRNAVWALSNMCRSKPPPAMEYITPILPVLATLLNHSDREVATDACWAISYICDGPIERIQRVVQTNVIGKIVQMLNSNSVAMQTPALRTIGNIVTGNDIQTQVIIDNGALMAFHGLLRHTRRAIKKEACWCLSNICAGSADQVQSIIAADLYPVIIELMDAPEYEVKKEAVWCLANTTSGGTGPQLRYLIEMGVVQPLCRALTLYDAKIVTVALETLENFLQLGEEEKIAKGYDRNPVADMIISCGGTELIENLQEHNSPELYNLSKAMIEAFFDFTATADTRGAADEYDFSGAGGAYRGGDGDYNF